MIFPIKPYKTQLFKWGDCPSPRLFTEPRIFSAVAQRVSRQANLNGNLAAGYELKSQLIRAANNVWPMASHSLLRKYQQMWLGLKLSKIDTFPEIPCPKPSLDAFGAAQCIAKRLVLCRCAGTFLSTDLPVRRIKPRGCWCLECLETPENHEQLNSPC